jgi:hypothetical protein
MIKRLLNSIREFITLTNEFRDLTEKLEKQIVLENEMRRKYLNRCWNLEAREGDRT